MSRKIPSRYSPKRTENEIRTLWEEKKAYERSREKRSHGKDIYVLDSLHETRDSSDPSRLFSMIMKDAFIRYLRMRGNNVRDTPGIEGYAGEVEAAAIHALGISSEEIGSNPESFINQCKKEAKELEGKIAESMLDMGIWMDWKRPYDPIETKYMDSVWFTFKELNERGLLGRFKGISQWCPNCRTFVSRSDMKVEKDWKKGIYVKFELKERGMNYLVVWFSEPWKITATLALEASPSKKYSVVEIKGGREKIIVGSSELDAVMKDCGIKDYRKVGEISGEKLVGMRYLHPLFGSTAQDDDIIDIGMMESEELNIDRVLAGNSTGRTGIKGIVPAHSSYDLSLAERNGIQVLTPVSESGELGSSTGKYAGFTVFDANSIIVRDLINTGAALAPMDVLESTAHCRRCGTELIPMISEEWSFKPSEISERVEEAATDVEWNPSWMMGADYEWMEQVMPIPISKKGYWGVPMPVWVCQSCGHTEVIGSLKELQKISPDFKKGMGIYRPWIDRYSVKCPRCGDSMKRVSEVLLPDFASMASSWAQLSYPAMESEYRRWWPADFVLEPLTVSRTWIYSQMAVSSAIFEKAPFKRAISTGGVSFPKGVKLAGLMERYGADILRYALLSGGSPWYDRKLLDLHLERVRSVFERLWNIHRFVSLYYGISDFKPEEVSLETVHEYGMSVDLWMLSLLEESRDEYIKSMDSYRPDKASDVLISLIDSVSKWYLRAVRTRIRSGDMERREVLSAYRTLYEAMVAILRMLAPFSPHIAEKMYQDIGGKEPTVHSEDIGTPNKLLIDRNLDVRMEIAMDIIRSGRKARRRAGIPLRWPLSRIVVKAASKEVIDAAELFAEFIMEELNVKTIETVQPAQEWEEMILEVQPNPDAIGMVYRQWSSRIAVMLKNRPAKRIREEIQRGEYYLGIEGQMVKIEPNMVKFVSALPDYVVEQKFLDGSVYLDVRRDEKLMMEGRMREIVRRVQDMRKDLDLSFRDYIDLNIAGNEDIEDAVMEWGEEIARMVNAREIALTNEEGIEGEYMVEWYIEGEPVIIGIEPLYWEEMMAVLTRIPGIKRQKAEAIFDEGYTNLALLLQATEKDLSSIPGISSGIARKILSYARKNFAGGAELIKKGTEYECSICGATLDEPLDVCPKCHLPLHLREETGKAQKEPVEQNEKETEKEKKEDTGEDTQFMEKMAKIKGIGPSRAKLLYQVGYRSEDDLRKAGVAEVSKVKRMSPAMAELLFKSLGIPIEEKKEKKAPKPAKKESAKEAKNEASAPEKADKELSEVEFVKAITGIKGLGPSRARKIYRAGYHSIGALKKASVDELAKIPRMSRALAEQVKKFVDKM